MTFESKPLISPSVEEFRKFLSPPRLDKYLEFADGDLEGALRLYKQNLDISIAFQIPLHFCEIGIRNAVSETLCKAHGKNWPWNEGFTQSLSRKSRTSLCSERNEISTEKVVVKLSFGFWEHMFTNNHRGLWINRIRHALPNLPYNKTPDELIKLLKSEIEKVRILRNNIAHHERIIEKDGKFNPTDELRRIFKLVYWQSSVAEEWLKSFEKDGYFSAILEYKTPCQ